MAGKVRILKEKLFKVKKDNTKLLYVEGACDNDATPPQGNFVTGSAFENVTSGNKYKYSETSGDWVLQPNEGGGGTGGGVLVVSPNMDTGVLDKTWKEITDAPFAVLKYTEDNITHQICPLSSYDEKAQGVYYRVTFKVNEQLSFTGYTNDPDGYPTLQ